MTRPVRTLSELPSRHAPGRRSPPVGTSRGALWVSTVEKVVMASGNCMWPGGAYGGKIPDQLAGARKIGRAL